MRNPFLINFLLILISCKTKQDIKISEVYSNTYVTLSENFKQSSSDSVCLNIPLEFELSVPDNTDKLRFQLFINNHYKQYVNDYTIKYFKDDIKQTLYDGIDFKEMKNPKKVKIKLFLENMLISKKSADSLLIKYTKGNIKSNDIKRKDSIKLIPYINFRKENFEIMKFLRKKDNILLMNARNRKNELSTKHKIVW